MSRTIITASMFIVFLIMPVLSKAESMPLVQLYYAKTHVKFDTRQSLFSVHLNGKIAVSSRYYDKQIYVHYAINHGQWEQATAFWSSSQKDGSELWSFEVFLGEELQSGGWVKEPYDVQFAIEYRHGGQSYWDNNGGFGLDYRIGVRQTASDYTHLILGKSALALDRAYYNDGFGGSVFLKDFSYFKSVKVVYSSDYWQTAQIADLQYIASPAEGLQEWHWFVAPDTDVFNGSRIEFAIVYVLDNNLIWDNNFSKNYVVFEK